MSLQSDLVGPDRERLWAVIDPIIESFDATGDSNVGHIGSAVVEALRKLAEAGEDWPVRVLLVCENAGTRQLVKGRMKGDRCAIRIAHTGAVIDMPARMGVEVKNPSPPPPRIYQLPLWWDLTWEQFEALVDSVDRQRDKLAQEVVALEEVKQLHERFADTRTPGEACERAGIDPRKFDTGSDGGGSDGTGTEG
jgi:hypothetical protein